MGVRGKTERELARAGFDIMKIIEVARYDCVPQNITHIAQVVVVPVDVNELLKTAGEFDG